MTDELQQCNCIYKRTRYIPAPKWNKYHIWPTLGGLRHLIHNKEKNGFDRVVKKVGKNVLIDENAFFEWIENQQGNDNEERIN